MRTPKSVFLAYYGNNTNFMTPEPLSYHKIGNYAIEISQGRGMDNQLILGVTVLDYNTGPLHNISRLFHSEKEVNDYLEALSLQQEENEQHGMADTE